MTIIAPYINEHKRMLGMANRGRSKRWLITEHNKTFSQWLKDKVKASYGLETMDQIVQHLGSGPEHLVTTYQGYDISGYTFYTDQQDHKNGYVSEPFILAKQATQVFYIEDPKDSRKHIVMHSKRRILGVDNVVDEEEYNQFDELPPFSLVPAASSFELQSNPQINTILATTIKPTNTILISGFPYPSSPSHHPATSSRLSLLPLVSDQQHRFSISRSYLHSYLRFLIPVSLFLPLSRSFSLSISCSLISSFTFSDFWFSLPFFSIAPVPATSSRLSLLPLVSDQQHRFSISRSYPLSSLLDTLISGFADYSDVAPRQGSDFDSF
ncbi:hypothetical protein LXL04_007364 [Taraxacum kok-saghyz]